ncbi:BRCA1-associated protein-like [Neocloeon triangulifer]|uniref:BRCA1-associated protein-like n=1 Tax=Neocloeon triangulifer TaxID=2078957 RepID=UPI00286FA20E|nr:BRCA1-associated protein-like [Neocloeon triangulifer]
MSFGVSLCLFRLEIGDEYPLLDHLSYTAPKYQHRRMASRVNPKGKLLSGGDSKKQKGQREMRSMRVETVLCPIASSSPPVNSPCSSKEQTPQPADSTGDSSSIAETVASSSKTGGSEPVAFVSGNPFVEVTKGILHLYKENELTSMEDEAQRSEQVCLLAVPSSLSCQDLLAFTAACHEDMKHLRIIRPEDSSASLNHYMALIEFRSQVAADEFYRTFHGIPYSSLSDDELCNVAYVSGVEVVREGDCVDPPPGHTELPTCPVCLERMDESVDGILTILCNHSFHSNCLAKWVDATCPVCRYVQTPEAVDNKCFECQSADSLWICLICGHVGCGRYVQGHASQHFLETQHCYSMQLGSNRVWDYVGDNFVHRLLQNKDDGKMVAVGADQEGRSPEKPGAGDEKVDSLQLEFTYLLTSQLESQRLYFEDRMIRLQQEVHNEREELRERVDKLSEENQRLKKQVDSLKKDKQTQEKKIQTLNAKLLTTKSELQQEVSMSHGMQQNQSAWQEKFSALESKFNDYQNNKEKELTDLKEQLRDVMFFFEAQNQISQSELKDEISEGQIVMPEPQSDASASGSKNRRKKHR